jgi:hypothetical protein
MHHSRLCAVLIDCKTADLDEAARFWAAALGCPVDLGHASPTKCGKNIVVACWATKRTSLLRGGPDFHALMSHSCRVDLPSVLGNYWK